MEQKWLWLAALGIMNAGVALGEQFAVDGIRLEGLERVKEGTVYNYLPVQTGEIFDTKDSPLLIQTLFNSGYFDDIQVFRDDSTLVIKLKERPAIGAVDISGNKGIPKDKLLESLKESGIATGLTYNQAVVNFLENELAKMYYNHGKYGVTVETKLTPKPNNRVDLTINIDEGDVATIKGIGFIGNHHMSDETLLSLLSLKEATRYSWITKSDQYDRERLMADLEAVRTYYLDRGYLNFSIESAQVSISDDKRDLFINIVMDEGKQYSLKSIQFAGELILSEEEWRERIQLKMDQPFSRTKVSKLIEGMTEILGEKGYSFASINPVPEVNEDDRTVDLVLYFQPNQKVTVRNIDYVGNKKTKDDVLRHLTVQFEGAPINTRNVEQSKLRMDRSGFFKSAKANTQPVPGTTDQVDITYEVEEAGSGSVTGGIGYSNVDKVVANASLTNRNFMGTGKSVNINFNYAKAHKTANFAYNDPFYTVDGTSRGYNVFFSTTSLARTSAVAQYVTDVYGGNVSWGVPVSETTRLSYGVGVQRTLLKLSDFDRNGPANTLPPQEIIDFTDKYGSNYNEYNFALGWSQNTFNRYLFPTKGLNHGLSLHVSLPGSTLQYFKSSYHASFYNPITAGFIFNATTNMGYGDGYGGTEEMPFFKHFFAGGPQNYVRGFEDRSLGPKVRRVINPGLGNIPSNFDERSFGGNFLAAGSMSVIFPNFFGEKTQSIRLSAFLDGGQVYDLRNKLRSDSIAGITPRNTGGFRYSAGISVNWITPMAPLIFNYAFPLNDRDGDRVEQFSFNFGTVF